MGGKASISEHVGTKTLLRGSRETSELELNKRNCLPINYNQDVVLLLLGRLVLRNRLDVEL